MRARRGRLRGRRASTIEGMVRRTAFVAFWLCAVTLLAPACQRAGSRPALGSGGKAEDFHHSDPKIIAATGRPQLLEFFGPT